MIEREARHVVHAEPRGVARVGRGLHVVVAQVHERVVGDRHHALARIAVDGAEGVELLEEDLAQAGLFLELAPRRFIERFVDAHEAARQRPLALRTARRPRWISITFSSSSSRPKTTQSTVSAARGYS